MDRSQTTSSAVGNETAAQLLNIARDNQASYIANSSDTVGCAKSECALAQ
jgi:hypothetical protein